MTFFSINIDFFEIGVSQIKLNKMVHFGIRVFMKFLKKQKEEVSQHRFLKFNVNPLKSI